VTPRRFVLATAIAIALQSLATASVARADTPSASDSETALQLFKEGKALRDVNDFQGALGKFRAAYGETPYSYLMTRRIERASFLLRQGMSVTDTCMAVGCTSLGSFSSRFTEIVGETPTQYRSRDHSGLEAVPACVAQVATRPRRSRTPA